MLVQLLTRETRKWAAGYQVACNVLHGPHSAHPPSGMQSNQHGQAATPDCRATGSRQPSTCGCSLRAPKAAQSCTRSQSAALASHASSTRLPRPGTPASMLIQAGQGCMSCCPCEAHHPCRQPPATQAPGPQRRPEQPAARSGQPAGCAAQLQQPAEHLPRTWRCRRGRSRWQGTAQGAESAMSPAAAGTGVVPPMNTSVWRSAWQPTPDGGLRHDSHNMQPQD